MPVTETLLRDRTTAAPRPAQAAPQPRIAVLIPCYNEEVAVPRVVAAFRAALPEATVDRHANTSAASVPLALDTAVRDGRIKRGDLLVLEAMGGGFTWGAAVLRY